MVDLTRKYDVLVIGGGNAALCAAISARRAGASVLVLEGAPKFYRGGNTRHTRNMRCAHDAATDMLTGPYTEEEFWDDLLRVTGGQTDEELARHMIRESKDILDWIVEQGVRLQPSLGGTLSLGRTNSFFLGGGRAMLNALYLTAEQLGVEIALRRRGGRSRHRRRHVPAPRRCKHGGDRVIVRAATLVAAAGGFEANIEWLKQYWGDGRRQFPDPRHALQSRHGAEDAARQRRAGRSAIRRNAMRSRSTRARRNSTAASSRGTTASCSASSSTSTRSASTTRARTSGRSATRSGAGWSPQQPDQIAYIIFDASRRCNCSCRRSIRRSRRDASRELAGKLDARSGRAGKNRRRLQRRGAARHLRPHHPRRLPHRRADAAEDALGAADRDAALLRLSGAARHHLHLSRHAREQAGAHADEGRQARRPTCSRPARSWPAMCSGKGYAAGIGMTIGSVFGRIAGGRRPQCPQLRGGRTRAHATHCSPKPTG